MKRFELKQQFSIESARFLPKLPKTHPCAHTHGHSFKITITLQGAANELGWLRDYHEINLIVAPVLREIDHKVLNDIPGLENPTTEELTYWLYNKIKAHLPELVRVSVSETSNTECSYPI